jgi:hypothetical protein
MLRSCLKLTCQARVIWGGFLEDQFPLSLQYHLKYRIRLLITVSGIYAVRNVELYVLQV